LLFKKKYIYRWQPDISFSAIMLTNARFDAKKKKMETQKLMR